MARKKSFMERMGLIERVGGEEEDVSVDIDFDDLEEEPVEVVSVNADAVDFIGQTYHNNNIDDLSRSVFKAEEIMNTLPNTLPSEVRHTTTVGILTSFGISVQDIIDDADKRQAILGEVRNQTMEAEQENVDALLQEIEELRTKITDKQQQVQDHQARKEEIENICNEEIKRILAVVSFLK